MNAEFAARLDASIQQMIQIHSLAVEKLTEQQVANAIKQAILAGDFTKYLIVSADKQTIVYQPFRECEELREENARLKEQLATYQVWDSSN